MAKFLITGGSGFIGSNLIRYLLKNTTHSICNVDLLSYAGDEMSLKIRGYSDRYQFSKIDICDSGALTNVLSTFRPNLIIHLAAESHVDRSIDSPLPFVKTNILGTYNLLEASRHYWGGLNPEEKNNFRFHHVSTDEVFGDLGPDDNSFTEKSCYAPSSPYSATKAGSDHLVNAWYRTFGFPILISHSSNNYGPYQYPEKFIPNIIIRAIRGKEIPIYGNGKQVRDWLHVKDHVRALYLIATKAKVGMTYNVGGNNEKQNIDLAREICSILDKHLNESKEVKRIHSDLITFVSDRPGHDKRYSVDSSKLYNDLGWAPEIELTLGLEQTVSWYLENENWWQKIFREGFRLERLGSK